MIGDDRQGASDALLGLGPTAFDPASLVEMLNRAQSHVRLVIFRIDLDRVRELLLDALSRHVSVEIIVDYRSMVGGRKDHRLKQLQTKAGEQLINAGARCQVHWAEDHLLHHKTAIVDDSVVVSTGNWTAEHFQGSFDLWFASPDAHLYEQATDWYENLSQAHSDHLFRLSTFVAAIGRDRSVRERTAARVRQLHQRFAAEFRGDGNEL